MTRAQIAIWFVAVIAFVWAAGTLADLVFSGERAAQFNLETLR
jgi:hypothetical protein